MHALKRVTDGKWAAGVSRSVEKVEPGESLFTESTGLEAQPQAQPETPPVLQALPRASREEVTYWLSDFGPAPKNPVTEWLTNPPPSQQNPDEINTKPLSQPPKPKLSPAQIMGVFGSSVYLTDKADMPKKKLGAAGKKKTAAKKKTVPKK